MRSDGELRIECRMHLSSLRKLDDIYESQLVDGCLVGEFDGNHRRCGCTASLHYVE